MLARVDHANLILTQLIRHASSSSMRRFEWTFVHSMYAGMGGFAFDMDLLPEDYGPLFPNQQRLTLTASGALNVARCGYLPDVSLREINDKSKADGLAKALVCLQAGWMVLQTLGRMWAREPVTLLEVNTLGHVFCTFIIYLLWWHKPREVREPTVIQGPQVHLLCTYSYMASRISGRRPDQRFCLDKWRKPELSRYGWFTHADTETLPKVDTPQTLAPPSPPLWRPSQVSFDLILEQSEQPLSHGSTKTFPGHFGPRPESEPEVELKTIIKRGTTFAHRLISGDTSENQHCRRRLATEAIWTFPPLQQKLEPQVFVTPSGNRIDWLEPHLEQLVVTTAGDWPSDHYLPGIAGELMGMALWFASMGYGAVHAAAWQEYFPSDAEKFMWRFSSVYITCAGAIWFGACIIGWRFHWASLYWDRFIALQARWYDYAFWGLFATACGLAYVVARLFLVVDAIVSLRSMPATAYNTPNWSTLIPHL